MTRKLRARINFAIGFTGKVGSNYDTKGLHYANTRAGYWDTPQEGKYYGFPLMGSGYIESPDKPAELASLFTQQLIDRIGQAEAMKVLRGEEKKLRKETKLVTASCDKA